MTYFEITFDRAAAAAGRVDVWRVMLSPRPGIKYISHVRAVYFQVFPHTIFDPTLDPPGRLVGQADSFPIIDGILTVGGAM